MGLKASGFVYQQRIDQGVTSAARALAPDVVRIRYSFGEDWSGSDAIFFRVLLSDEASRRDRLRAVAREVTSTVFREVAPDELGLQAYFNFRSAAEQAQLKEEAWA
ncbi:MAG: hypothetical protein IT165_31230 [Bryobacterales bacterium]|nr:hypothetical protein [Bryobacterales bacterium]